MTGEMTEEVPADPRDEAAAVSSVRNESCSERILRLFTLHQRRLYLLARRLSPNADDALDMVQETFLRAARTYASLPGNPTAEEGWLVRVLVNLYRDRWRQAADRRRLDVYVEHNSQQTRRDAESPLIAQALVWGAMQTLAPRRRAVVVLREIEGASVAEIAHLLGISGVTVRWHLSRARRELRRALGGPVRP